MADGAVELIGLGGEHAAIDACMALRREHRRDLVQAETGRASHRDEREALEHAGVEYAPQPVTADGGNQPLLLVEAQGRGRQAGASGDFSDVDFGHGLDFKST